MSDYELPEDFLEQLDRVQAELDREKEQLVEKEKELIFREKDLATQQRKLEAREARLDVIEEKLKERYAKLKDEEKRLEVENRGLETQQKWFKAEKASLEEEKERIAAAPARELGDRYRCPEEYNLVFVTSMGSPVTRYILGKEINNIVDEINLKENIEAIKENRNPIVFEKVYPHALRHTFCSRCFERGLNPKVVQKLMGHQNYSTTIDIYTHVTENAYDEEVRKFNMGISGDPPAFGSGFGLEPLYCK